MMQASDSVDMAGAGRAGLRSQARAEHFAAIRRIHELERQQGQPFALERGAKRREFHVRGIGEDHARAAMFDLPREHTRALLHVERHGGGAAHEARRRTPRRTAANFAAATPRGRRRSPATHR